MIRLTTFIVAGAITLIAGIAFYYLIQNVRERYQRERDGLQETER